MITVPLLLLLLLFTPDKTSGQSAGLAGLEIEEPDNEADWPKDDDWILVIESVSQLYCPLSSKLQCEQSNGASTTDLTSAAACSNKCTN